MEKKPWPIIILAMIHFMEPIAKIFFYSWLWSQSPTIFFEPWTADTAYFRALFFFGFPVAGFAIYMVKNWSLPVFMGVQALTLIGHIQNYSRSPESFPIYLVAGVTFLNCLVVLYFLVPAVRAAYTDPRLRWWETKPRYRVDWDCSISLNGKSYKSTILNISEGGMFLDISSAQEFDLYQMGELHFTYEKYNMSLTGQLVHHTQLDNGNTYGVRFAGLSTDKKKMVKSCIQTIEDQGFERRPKRETNWASFSTWAKTFMTTGKGMFPDVPNRKKSNLKIVKKTNKKESKFKKSA